MRLFKYFSLFLILALPAWGADFSTLADGGVHKVASVVDGDTVVLDNGKQVRLVGIQAPKLPLDRLNFKPWPLGDEAKAHLKSQILGQDVHLHLGTTAQDRHGRILAHVVRKSDGLWVQGDLLRRGLARVYTFPDNRKLGADMLALERQARKEGLGLWGLPYYAIRSAYTVRHDVGTFQVVEGKVFDVARVRKRIYLNFSADWRHDFTIQIDHKNEGLFTAQGIDLTQLKGKRVRVRGWVKQKNGPLIQLDHPERLEIIEP